MFVACCAFFGAADALVMRIVHLRLNKSDEVVGRWGARKAALVGDFSDRRANLGRDFPDPRQRGVEATLFEVGFTDGVGERVGRRHEHLVGDQTAAARDYAEADAWEDIGVVALARHESPAVELYGIEWAAAGK